ncbi:MAG: hypothetical protein K5989_07440 [Lachnospiraceae bacterium]|nr:hypothetical protein [Lachnospiraceae bacterium]
MNQKMQIQNEIEKLRAEEKSIRAELDLRENDYKMQRNTMNAQIGGSRDPYPKKSGTGKILLVVGLLCMLGGFGAIFFILEGQVFDVFQAFVQGPFEYFKIGLDLYLEYKGMTFLFYLALIAFCLGLILLIVGLIVKSRSGNRANMQADESNRLSTNIKDLDARYQADVAGLQNHLNLISSQIEEKEKELSRIGMFSPNSEADEDTTEKLPHDNSRHVNDGRVEQSRPSAPNPAESGAAAFSQSDIVKFYCPHCGQKLGAPKRMFLRGQVECSRCHKLIDTSMVNRLTD